MSLLGRLFGMAEVGTPGPHNPFWYTDPGTATASGERITPDVAEQVACIYRGKQLISEGVAKFNLKVMRRLPGGGSVDAPEHPVSHLFRGGPNETDSAIDFIDETTGTAVLRGKGYAEIVEGPGGFADQLVPLDFDKVTEKRLTGPGKRLAYEYREADGKIRPLDNSRIFRLSGPNGGKSLLARMRETAGMARASEAYGSTLFGKAPLMAGFLTPKDGVKMNPEQLTDAAKAFGMANSGRKGWHRAAVLPGMEWQAIGMTARDAQMLELRKFTREEIAIFFGLPPHKLGGMDKAGYASVEAQNKAVYDDCLMQWFIRWEQCVAAQLLRPIAIARGTNPDEFFAKFNIDALLRATTAERAQAEAVWVVNGILTRNEVRAIEDRNPLPGLDEPLIPSSNAQLPSTAPRPAAPPAVEPPADPNLDGTVEE